MVGSPSDMIKLKSANYPAVYALYRIHEAFFPLIGAVLLGEQNGAVYADRSDAPTQVYVEHAFGFAQIFGTAVPQFEAALKDYLLVDRNFAAAKVRLYTPNLPDFLRSEECESLRSQRQRFTLNSYRGSGANNWSEQPLSANIQIRDVDRDNVTEIELRFGVVGRFWRTPEEFIRKAHAIVALVEEKPAAICYAAAVADGRAEIDVLTLPEYRHLGLGKLVVTLFNTRCLEQGLLPLWDCFTNNAGSMALCKSAGFVPTNAAYPFFTFNK